MKKIIVNVNHVGIVSRKLLFVMNKKEIILFLASDIKQEPIEHKFVQQIHEGLKNKV